jgi:protein ImuB
MPLAEARALGTDAHFAPHEPHADHEALRRLARWCQRFGRAVAVEEVDAPESLLVDITGCAPLFRGEKALVTKVVHDLRRYGYWTRAAIADTVGAAWAVAHYGAERSGVSAAVPAIVPVDSQLEALRPLPIESLRLSRSVVQALHPFDIRRIDQLLALPRAALPSRFGKEVIYRIDQALGHIPELLTPEPVVEPIEASWDFEPAAADLGLIEKALEQLLEQILKQLWPQQLGVQCLLCSLRITGGETVPVRVGLLQPSASTGHLLGLVHLHFERLRLPGEVSTLVVRAAEVAPLEFSQEELFDGQAGSDRWRLFPVLIERLSSRLGEKAVLRPRLLSDAQPEYACCLEPWLVQDALTTLGESHTLAPAKTEEAPLRPPCLKDRPIAVRAVSLDPGGPPERFIWQGQCHVIAHAWGPERIETGWWRGADINRDYYLVESTAGQRFWLFRALRDQGWFLHGTFA